MTHAIAMLYARWTLTKIPHEPATLLSEVVTRLTPNIHKDLNHVERSLEGKGREYLVREKELMAADVLVCPFPTFSFGASSFVVSALNFPHELVSFSRRSLGVSTGFGRRSSELRELIWLLDGL